jgi:hypothetical protein
VVCFSNAFHSYRSRVLLPLAFGLHTFLILRGATNLSTHLGCETFIVTMGEENTGSKRCKEGNIGKAEEIFSPLLTLEVNIWLHFPNVYHPYHLQYSFLLIFVSNSVQVPWWIGSLGIGYGSDNVYFFPWCVCWKSNMMIWHWTLLCITITYIHEPMTRHDHNSVHKHTSIILKTL